MQILHPFSGSVPQYEQEISCPDRYRPNHCPQCETQEPLLGHGFYSRTLVDGAWDGDDVGVGSIIGVGVVLVVIGAVEGTPSALQIRRSELVTAACRSVSAGVPASTSWWCDQAGIAAV